MTDLIKKKKEGNALTRPEIARIIDGFTAGEIPDYQMSAFLMAVYFQKMTQQETADLTDVMMHSGEIIDLSEIPGIKVDKHSTGGVGDKTTLVLAPIVAAAGVPIAKMSGRGLGHTGGTLDKMESIPGLSFNMTSAELIEKVKKHGIALCGQNTDLVPADKKIYALRDVTETVDNISLMSSSIMSKKLACGADAIVLDLKVGNGSYIKTVEHAEEFANMLISIGANMGRKTVVVISNMNEPLGRTIGNALEVREAIETLQGNGPEDLTELCLELGSRMLLLGGKVSNQREGKDLIKKLIASGAAFEKFKEFVKSQGGDLSVVENLDLLPKAKFSTVFKSKKEGFVSCLNALDVGVASMKLGAGRETKTSEIDLGAGILLKKKIGDFVKKGEELAILYSSDQGNFGKAEVLLEGAFEVSEVAPKKMNLILKTME